MQEHLETLWRTPSEELLEKFSLPEGEMSVLEAIGTWDGLGEEERSERF